MQPSDQRDGGNNVTKRFFAEGEQRIGGSDAGKYYYTRDHLGSVREVTDAAGALTGQYDYDAWGNSVVTKGKMQVDFGYTGHYFHQPSGLNLSRFRAYSSSLGRWISRDPLKNAEMWQGANLYWYVGNDPENVIDPEGRFAFIPVILAILAGKATIDAVFGMTEAGIAAKSAADEVQAYRDTVDRIKCRYGGDIPPEIQQALDKWRSDIINDIGEDAATIIRGVPGTTFTGSPSDPGR